jgi:3-hydroxyisobutyrate dehydrogenase
LNTYCPAPGVLPQTPSSNNYKAGFTATMMLKDLNLAANAAAEIKSSLPMTHTAKEVYQAFCNEDGQLDFSGILCYLKTLTSN